MKIIVTGSCQPHYDAFRAMCQALGNALAESGHQILLLSDDERHADPFVIAGYFEAATRPSVAPVPAVLVSYGSSTDPENQDALKFSKLRDKHPAVTLRDVDIRGEYPFNRVAIVRQVDVVIALGGAEGARQLMEIADALDVPIVPFAAYGEVAKQVFDRRRLLLEQAGVDVSCLTRNTGDASIGRAREIVRVAETLVSLTNKLVYKTDLAVLTAVDVEFAELRKAFPELLVQLADDRYRQYASGTVAERKVVAFQQHEMGMPSTAATAMQVIHEFRPRYLAMTGIAAGVEGKTNLGDILIADPSWDYGSGKIVTGEEGSGHRFQL